MKLIKGGLHPSNPARYKFISAEVSDTRLMGVLALHMVFEDSLLARDFPVHHFYYYDCEETGLESLEIKCGAPDEIRKASAQAFAGLGAGLVSLSESESFYLVRRMVEETVKKKQALPDELAEAAWLVESGVELAGEELQALWSKICVPIKSDYGVLNYFLMRFFGLDTEAARYLASPLTEFPKTGFDRAGLLRNKTELLAESAGEHKLYRCESLIEFDDSHRLVVSTVGLYRRRVESFEIVSDFPVSVYEATLMLSKEEYVSLYDMTRSVLPDALIDAFASSDEPELPYYATLDEFTLGMTMYDHPAGLMFMDFKPDNEHAERKLFRLSDDVQALYFISNAGQMIVAAGDQNAIILAETKLAESGVLDHQEPAGRYRFPSSALYEFAESEYSDFKKYIGDYYGSEN